MRRIILSLTFILALSFSVVLSAQNEKTDTEQVPLEATSYVAGKDYFELENPKKIFAKNDEVEVLSFFWYGCGGCYKLDAALDNWAANLPPKGIKFVKAPALLGGAWDEHGRIYLTLKKLGVDKKAHPLVFKAMQEQRKNLLDKQTLADFLDSLKIDQTAFIKTYNSQEVEAEVKELKTLIEGYGFTGVPAVVVNGKYHISLGAAKSQANMLKIIDYLVAKEAK